MRQTWILDRHCIDCCIVPLMARLIAIKTTFDGAVAHEVRYWLSRSVEERISGVEAIRRASWRLYGGAPTRMARVSARVEAPWRPVANRARVKDIADLALLDELKLAEKPVRAKRNRRSRAKAS